MVITMQQRKKFCVQAAWLFSILLVALIHSNAYAAIEGGTVILVKGIVTSVSSNGESRILAKKDSINTNDTVITAAKSFVVIRMADQTKITLKPESSMLIGEFDQEKGKEVAALRLVKGGFRSITGLIGKAKPEAFRLETAVATMGIRGTDMQGELCSATSDCKVREDELRTVSKLSEYLNIEDATLPGEINELLPLGFYVLVNEGTIFLEQCDPTDTKRTSCKTVDITKGQVGYAGAVGEVLGRTKAAPLILKSEPSFNFTAFNEQQADVLDIFNDADASGVICEFN